MTEWWFVEREYAEEDGVRLLREEGKDELVRSLLTFHYAFIEREPESGQRLIGYLIRGSRVWALVISGMSSGNPIAEFVDIEEWLASSSYYYDDPTDP